MVAILKKRVKWPLALIILALALALFVLLGAARYQDRSQEPLGELLGRLALPRIELANVYADTFREPFEICLFQFVDGTRFTITTQDEGFIQVPMSQVIKIIRVLGGVENLLLVVHSHPIPSGFSLVDNALYALLKENGFRGVFGIYCGLADSVTIKTDLGWGKK